MKFSFGLKQYISAAAVALTFASTAFAATAYINQVGYRTTDPKEFTLFEGSGDIEIKDAAGQVALRSLRRLLLAGIRAVRMYSSLISLI